MVNSIVGSSETLKVTIFIPVFFNDPDSGPARSTFRPVTSRAQCPIFEAIGATSFTVPCPKIIREAVANSNFITNPTLSHPGIH